MKEKVSSIVFLTILFFFSVMTFYTAKASVRYIIDNTSRVNNNIKDFPQNIDKVLKDGFYKKSDVVNFYGLAERILCRRLSSDKVYYRDNDNVMHWTRGIMSHERFFNDVNWLSGFCRNKNIPFMVCQVPERGLYGNYFSKLIDGTSTAGYINELKNITLKNGDLYLDSIEVLKNKQFSSTDIFFSSDGHCKTLTEITEVNEIVRLLTEKGIIFPNAETVLEFENPEYYDKILRNFLGNFSNQYGRFYVGVDKFEYYIPKFKTDLQRINKEGQIYKTGDFTQSIMNGFLDDGKDYKYWVIDFLQWPEPYYEIINNEYEKAPNILVFIDSYSMRAVSYLSLMCKNVTILDPRYFNESNNYFNKIKNKDYDAVIVFATFDLFRGLSYN